MQAASGLEQIDRLCSYVLSLNRALYPCLDVPSGSLVSCGTVMSMPLRRVAHSVDFRILCWFSLSIANKFLMALY